MHGDSGWWSFLWIPLLLLWISRWGRTNRGTGRGRHKSRRHDAGLDQSDREALSQRLATVDHLESRVEELENRLDFTERLLAERREAQPRAGLPGGS